MAKSIWRRKGDSFSMSPAAKCNTASGLSESREYTVDAGTEATLTRVLATRVTNGISIVSVSKIPMMSPGWEVYISSDSMFLYEVLCRVSTVPVEHRNGDEKDGFHSNDGSHSPYVIRIENPPQMMKYRWFTCSVSFWVVRASPIL